MTPNAKVFSKVTSVFRFGIVVDSHVVPTGVGFSRRNGYRHERKDPSGVGLRLLANFRVRGVIGSRSRKVL